MILSPEFRLLCFSLRVDDRPSAIAGAEKIIDSDQTDWEKLYNGAMLHGIRPQLAGILRMVNPEKIPAGFREKIDAACQENLFRQLSHVAEFFRINGKLEDAGIKAVPFKVSSLLITYMEILQPGNLLILTCSYVTAIWRK